MKKVLIAYYSRTGMTQKMADYIAEGVRFTGSTAIVKKISELKNEKDLAGYDGYIFGCPTYYRDMTENFKTFLFMVQKAKLAGKPGAAFGSQTHTGEASKYIFETMEFVFKMDMTDLGPFTLNESTVDTAEGMTACQDYGKALAEKLGS